MISFLHIRSGLTFGTSRKVMSSFFVKNTGFRQIQNGKSIVLDFFVCRNPYARAVSLWRDKCVLNGKTPNQECQKLILRFLPNGASLSALTFRDFCHLLPNLICKDEHFWTQSHGLISSDYRQLIHIENKNEFPNLSDVDWGHVENSSEHIEFPLPIVNATPHKIITGLYDIDYVRFGYDL